MLLMIKEICRTEVNFEAALNLETGSIRQVMVSAQERMRCRYDIFKHVWQVDHYKSKSVYRVEIHT